MVSGVIRGVGGAVRHAAQPCDGPFVGVQKRQLQPAFAPKLMRHVSKKSHLGGSHEALFVVLLAHAMQGDEGFQVFSQLFGRAGNAVVEFGSVFGPANLAAKFVTVLAPQGRQVGIPLRRQDNRRASFYRFRFYKQPLPGQAVLQQHSRG